MKREENQTVEYKESWHEKYLEWVCGYANAKGGTLSHQRRCAFRGRFADIPEQAFLPNMTYGLTKERLVAFAEREATPNSRNHKSAVQVSRTSRPYKSTVQVSHTSHAVNVATAESRVGLVLSLLAKGELSLRELMQAVGLRNRPNFYSLYILPAFEMGCVEYTIHDRPKSRLQKYRLTDKGRAALSASAHQS